jgi:hypothetical protein
VQRRKRRKPAAKVCIRKGKLILLLVLTPETPATPLRIWHAPVLQTLVTGTAKSTRRSSSETHSTRAPLKEGRGQRKERPTPDVPRPKWMPYAPKSNPAVSGERFSDDSGVAEAGSINESHFTFPTACSHPSTLSTPPLWCWWGPAPQSQNATSTPTFAFDDECVNASPP